MREKKLTNVRNTGAEEKVHLSPPRVFTLEDAIGTKPQWCSWCNDCWCFVAGMFAVQSGGGVYTLGFGCRIRGRR